MRYITLLIIAFTICCSACRLKHTTESDNDLSVSFDPIAQLQQKSNELRKSGVDTILLFSKKCTDCSHLIHQKNKNGADKINSNEVFPAYLFWIHQGEYYVVKADQFHIYDPLKRSLSNQWPIYDYWRRNKDAILHEDYPASVSSQGGNTINRIYSFPAMNDTSDADVSSITMRLGSDTTTFSISKVFRSPVKAKNDSAMTANSLTNYYPNLLMKRYEFERIIQSELFETEYKKLWRISARHGSHN